MPRVLPTDLNHDVRLAIMDQMVPQQNRATRRQWLFQAGSGLGSLAVADLMGRHAAAGGGTPGSALGPHHPPRANAVIWLFMEGGPSHLDLFDPKPELQRLAGQLTPPSFRLPVTSATGSHRMPLLASPRRWKQYGQSGIPVSDWYPRIAEHVDELAVIRSCWANGLNHVGSVRQMNTGSILAGRPSLGSWVTYGLGAANDNLPTFVCLTDDKVVRGGPTNWSAGFLPSSYQGVLLQKQGPPILDLQPPATVTRQRQRSRFELLREVNERFGRTRPDEDELAARVASYELAFRMQAAAPEAIELSRETETTREAYGLNRRETAIFGGNCLLARRLVERGVRFVEVYCGSGSGWDGHSGLEANHTKWCGASDQPIAALLSDLRARGLLETTLVVWGGEFGRTPFSDTGGPAGKNYGRDHNPWGFTMWLAGGGIRGGQILGATDEIGLHAVERRCHVHDLHATVLHVLGLNHLDLTFTHNGREERATINDGEVLSELLA